MASNETSRAAFRRGWTTIHSCTAVASAPAWMGDATGVLPAAEPSVGAGSLCPTASMVPPASRASVARTSRLLRMRPLLSATRPGRLSCQHSHVRRSKSQRSPPAARSSAAPRARSGAITGTASMTVMLDPVACCTRGRVSRFWSISAKLGHVSRARLAAERWAVAPRRWPPPRRCRCLVGGPHRPGSLPALWCRAATDAWPWQATRLVRRAPSPAAGAQSGRVCAGCGVSLDGRRRQAIVCGERCRSRIRRRPQQA